MARGHGGTARWQQVLLGAVALLCFAAVLLLFLDEPAVPGGSHLGPESALAAKAQAPARSPAIGPGIEPPVLRGDRRPPGMDVLLFEDRFRSPISLRTGGSTDEGYTRGRGTWTPQYQYHQWGANPVGGSTPRDHSFLLNMSNPEVRAASDGWTPFETGRDGLKLKQQRLSTLPPRFRDWLRRHTDKEWVGGMLSTQHSFGVKPPYFAEVRLRMPRGDGLWLAVWTLGSDRRARRGMDSAPVIEKDFFEAYGPIPHMLINAMHMSPPGGKLRMPSQRFWDTGVDQSTRYATYRMYIPDERTVIFYNSLSGDGRPAHVGRWPDGAVTDQFDYFIISMGVGGGGPAPEPGPPTEATPDVNRLGVDYIRVWGSRDTPVYRNGIRAP
jgi:hypothetical protein